MPIFVTRLDVYVEAENPAQAKERVRNTEKESLDYPTEFVKTVEAPRRLEQDGTRTPYDSSVRTMLNGRPALRIGNAVVPEDAITGVKVHPPAQDDPGDLEPAAVDVFTTAGIGFFEHGEQALEVIDELGLDGLLAGLTRERIERNQDPS